jgi:hypothetical protein
MSTLRDTDSISTLASLLTHKQLEKVSPSWIAPKDDGSVNSSVACVRSRRVLGCPGRGVFPWSEAMDAVECAEREGELE